MNYNDQATANVSGSENVIMRRVKPVSGVSGWLDLFNAELSRKRHYPGPRSQAEGDDRGWGVFVLGGGGRGLHYL